MSTLQLSRVTHKKPSPIRQLVMLAPAGGRIPGPFRSVAQDSRLHTQLLEQVQQLRGRIMVEEGALPQSGLDAFGRHRSELDAHAWHLLMVSGASRVTGCVRYLVHPSNVLFSRLGLRRAAAASGCAKWAHRVRSAVEGELAQARREAFSLVELGGWVLERELRGTADGIRMALGAFAWSQIAGGCLGRTTATVKHGSSSMLRRIGGSSLHAFGEPLPRYYDPDYNCEIEMLRFDSRKPNPAYSSLIDDARGSLLSTPIICPQEAQIWQSAS